MSDFDEKDIIADAGSDFDEADIVSEARSPSGEEDESSFNNTVNKTALGAGAGAIANKVIGATANVVHNNLGDLDATQIKAIDENRDLYKRVSPLEDIMEQFRSLGDKTRQGGINSAAKARQALVGLPNVPVEEYYKTLAQPALDPKYSNDIATNKEADLFGSKLDEMSPQINEDKLKLAAIDSEMSIPYQDERLGINQSIKAAKYENKLGQLSAPPSPSSKLSIMDAFEDSKNSSKLSQLEDLLAQSTARPQVDAKDDFNFHNANRIDKETKLRDIDTQRGKLPDSEKLEVVGAHNEKRDAKKLERFDEKIAKAEDKIASETQKINDKKQAFQQNMADKKEKTSSLREAGASDAKARMQGRKDQVIFNKILDDEKSAQMKNLKQKEKMEKLLDDKRKLEAKMQERVTGAGASAKADMEALKNTPKKIRDVVPELQNKILGQDYASSLQDAIADVEHSSEISPVRLDQKLQEIRDNVPDGKQNTVGKFNAEMSKSVREKLRQLSPEGYAPNMDQAAESFKTEALWDKNGIRYNQDLDRVTLDDAGKSKINATLLDPKKNDSSFAYLQEALEDAKRQGNLPPNATVEDMLNTGKVSALKGEVGRLREGKALNAFDVNSIAKGEMSRAPGIMGKMGGTKLQEMLALYKNSGAGKAIQAAGKYGLPIAGGLAAGMSAASAAESGELSPEAALLSGSAEALNPLPGLDMVEGAKGGAAGINEAFAENTQEELTAAPEFGANDLGGADLVSQNPLAQRALSGFVKGAVSPIPAMATSAFEGLDKAGTERSNDARAMMEKRMNAGSAPKVQPHEEFKNFVEQKPEQIQDMLQLFSNDEKTATFLAPLEKAANADDRTRSAVLFGLYQQPAFRQALKAKRGM